MKGRLTRVVGRSGWQEARPCSRRAWPSAAWRRARPWTRVAFLRRLRDSSSLRPGPQGFQLPRRELMKRVERLPREDVGGFREAGARGRRGRREGPW